ncbi:MAG: hypothetical protein ACOYUB_00220 [Patescibacteria group bacterium]
MVSTERLLTFGRKHDFSIGINFKNWIFRYSDIEKWRGESRKLMINYLSDGNYRRNLVEKAHPRDQYRALELMARFSNPATSQIRDGYYEGTVEIAGDLFGSMLIHHLTHKDKSKLDQFVDRRLLLTIDVRSKALALDKVFVAIRDGGLDFDEKTRDYLAAILFGDLQINTFEAVGRHNGRIPPQVLDKVLELLHEKERKGQVDYFGEKM